MTKKNFVNSLHIMVLPLLFMLSGSSSAEDGTSVPGMLDGWIDAINGVLASVLFFDVLLLSMAFPNMFALYALSGKVKSRLDAYVDKLRSGELDCEVGLG